MRHALAQVAIVAGIIICSGDAAVAKPKLKGLEAQAIDVSARQIRSFGTARRPGRSAGKLVWLGGLTLSSKSSYFGGFSGLTISPDGTRIFAASDAGFWMSANMTAQDGVPVALENARVGPFRALSGRSLDTWREVDAEAVSLAKGTLENGELLISFERIHRIGRFPVRGGEIEKPVRYLKLPSYIKGLHGNRGLEGMELLKGSNAGAIIFFAEGRRNHAGNLRGWLISKGRTRELFLKPINGFDITGIAALPDGGFLALERRFRWSEGVKMRIRRVRPDELASGRVLHGEVLLDVDSSANIDNMEGIAVHQDSNNQTIITLISDNNFNFFQRNLILRFAIPTTTATTQ